MVFMVYLRQEIFSKRQLINEKVLWECAEEKSLFAL